MGIGPGHGSREEKPDALILFSCHDIVGVTLSFLTQIFNFFLLSRSQPICSANPSE